MTVKSELAPIVGRLRGYHSLMRGGHPSICEEAADTISDLLEALENARLQLEYMDARSPSGTTPAIIARIDAAIAKAKGAT